MVFDFLKKIVSKNKNADFTDTFYYIFQEYYQSLKEIYSKEEVTFEKASKLELALYLLFRSDFILQESSNPDIRQLFFERCLKKIDNTLSNDLLDICYMRLDIYGELYNDAKNKEGNIFLPEFYDFSHDWLISAIALCKDNYELMAKKRYIPLSLGLTANYPIKICLQELDIKYMKKIIENIKDIVKLSSK